MVIKSPSAQDAAVEFDHRLGVFKVFAGRFLAAPGTAGDAALLTPLPDIAVHVEQAKVVWLQAADGVSLHLRVAHVPAVMAQQFLGRAVVASRDRAGL